MMESRPGFFVVGSFGVGRQAYPPLSTAVCGFRGFIEVIISNRSPWGLVLVCLSVDGDSQGVERIFGALSAHMWPGMILKSGDMITEPMLPHGEELSEEESEYELEYEVLSADPWENIEERWVSASETHSHGGSTSPKEVVDDELRPSPDNETERAVVTGEKPTENDKCYEFENVEQLMSEIGNIRDNLQLMPDSQRREIAANLAMKMASMFGGDTDGEEES